MRASGNRPAWLDQRRAHRLRHPDNRQKSTVTGECVQFAPHTADALPMRLDPPADVTPVDVGANRRLTGRLPQQGIACDLGRVLDLSSGGMRVVTSRRLKAGATTRVRLFAHSVQCELDVRVAWVRAIGLIRREVGLIFEDVPQSVAKTVAAIAVTSRERRVL